MPRPDHVRARWGVVALFVVNGAGFASVVPRLPEIRAEVGGSNAAFGLALAANPFGAILAGLFVPLLVHRFGDRRVSLTGGACVVACLPLVALAGSWAALATGMLLAGLADTFADVGNNAHGLRVEQRHGRSIINSFHAAWSIAAVGGAAVGAAAAGLGVPRALHLGVVALVLLGVVATARPLLLAEGSGAVGEHADDVRRHAPRPSSWRPLTWLCLLLAMASMVEDTPAGWSALLLDDLGAGPALAGSGFVAFWVGMTVGRLAGDRLTDRWGRVSLARGGAAAATLALGAALLAGTPVALVASLGVAGLGASTLYPATFAAAGSLPGVAPATGMAVVAWVGRIGFLANPLLVGSLADATSLRGAFTVLPVAFLLVAAVAGSLAPGGGRRRRRQDPAPG